nr:MAG TPA: hypothetical protein [Bacteriophage sp.]
MAKFKVGDKVRLKKGLKVGTFYGGVLLSQSMKKSAEADGGIHEVIEIKITKASTTYYLDHTLSYTYGEEVLELVEEEEKTKNDLKDFLEALALMSQLERITKRLNEIIGSNEEE